MAVIGTIVYTTMENDVYTLSFSSIIAFKNAETYLRRLQDRKEANLDQASWGYVLYERDDDGLATIYLTTGTNLPSDG